MKTVMYLIRHGATAMNLAIPPRLQGLGIDQSLAALGVRQAEMTRHVLAMREFDAVYASPMKRAVQTARIIAEPHDLPILKLPNLIECDVGRWEGLSWKEIREREPEMYTLFQENPARNGYPEGESFADVYKRANKTLKELLHEHTGQTILVVAHHVVNRTYLAGLLGLSPAEAKQVTLANCSVSIVVREHKQTRVQTLNSTFHLQGVAV